MHYQTTTGLDDESIIELVSRIHQILTGRGIELTRHRLGLSRRAPEKSVSVCCD